MATVHHPAFPDVTQEVEGERLAAHLAQGWVLIPEKVEQPTPEPEPELAAFPSIGGFEYADHHADDTERAVPPRRRRRK